MVANKYGVKNVHQSMFREEAQLGLSNNDCNEIRSFDVHVICGSESRLVMNPQNTSDAFFRALSYR